MSTNSILYPDGDPDIRVCTATKNGLFCTRDAGHEGKHAAYGGEVEPYLVWK